MSSRTLWVLVAILSAIGVAIVVRRAMALQGSVVMAIHIAPGLVFILTGPWQFMSDLRRRKPRLHRWLGRVYLVSALIVGGTALVLTSRAAIGGATERAAVVFFDVLFLIALARGYAYIRRRKFAPHREWMIRAYAIGLAVTAIRPIVGVFFATSRLTGLTPRDFFGVAFWIGFSLHLVAAEAWIRRTRPSARG